jgi:hypothetical protein
MHKSFFVSINAIKTIDGNELQLGKASLLISKTYKDEVRGKIANKAILTFVLTRYITIKKG